MNPKVVIRKWERRVVANVKIEMKIKIPRTMWAGLTLKRLANFFRGSKSSRSSSMDEIVDEYTCWMLDVVPSAII